MPSKASNNELPVLTNIISARECYPEAQLRVRWCRGMSLLESSWNSWQLKFASKLCFWALTHDACLTKWFPEMSRTGLYIASSEVTFCWQWLHGSVVGISANILIIVNSTTAIGTAFVGMKSLLAILNDAFLSVGGKHCIVLQILSAPQKWGKTKRVEVTVDGSLSIPMENMKSE